MVDRDRLVNTLPWKTMWHRHMGVRTGDQLSTGLSMMAGLQGAVLLIAAKRADQVPSELAHQTFENTEKLQQLTNRNAELIQAVERLTREVHAATVGRPTTDGSAAPAPSGETDAR